MGGADDLAPDDDLELHARWRLIAIAIIIMIIITIITTTIASIIVTIILIQQLMLMILILQLILIYTRSPLQDSRLFGPRPWKILATTYEQMGS